MNLKKKIEIKISKEEVAKAQLSNRGHFEHHTGTGAHKDKKKYDRNRDKRNLEKE